MDRWIAKTKQLWKLGVFILLLIVDAMVLIDFVSIVNGFNLLQIVGTDQLGISLLFVVLTNVTFWWLFLIFRCRWCGLNVGKFVLTRSNTSLWFITLIGLRCCPRCGK